jgi:hypothetical protein
MEFRSVLLGFGRMASAGDWFRFPDGEWQIAVDDGRITNSLAGGIVRGCQQCLQDLDACLSSLACGYLTVSRQC